MSDIKVVRKHSLSIEQAKKIAQKAADELAREYDLESEWNGDTLSFSRSGVDGEMAVSGNEIRIGVKLGFLLKAFKPRIQQHVENQLDELIASASERTAVAKTGRAPAKGGTAAGKPSSRKNSKA
jgi:putative polyhydroxyalkanoate system protein